MYLLYCVENEYFLRTLYCYIVQLLFMGREYPAGAEYFRSRLRNAFIKNRNVSDSQEIEKLIGRGQFVIKELEALYMLRKYRAMKQRYYDDDEHNKLEKNLVNSIEQTNKP